MVRTGLEFNGTVVSIGPVDGRRHRVTVTGPPNTLAERSPASCNSIQLELLLDIDDAQYFAERYMRSGAVTVTVTLEDPDDKAVA